MSMRNLNGMGWPNLGIEHIQKIVLRAIKILGFPTSMGRNNCRVPEGSHMPRGRPSKPVRDPDE